MSPFEKLSFYDDSETIICDSAFYMQTIPQTDEEKFAMYMKCEKEKLVEMLMQCNRIIDGHFMQPNIKFGEYHIPDNPDEPITYTTFPR